ncbi:MAG: GFA family protein [Pseudomonadota bacterium]
MAEPVTGRCLCGAVTYRTEGPPKWAVMCHCESCRRACSAPLVAWMSFAAGTVKWTGERRFYQSSEIGKRSFCPSCGTQLSFETTRWPGEIHLYAVSRDDPQNYSPDLHCHYAERLKWLNVADTLDKHPGTAET